MMRFKRVLYILQFLALFLYASSLDIKQISSFGGYLENIKVRNNHIFISTTDGLKIFDSSDKKNIKLISKIVNLGESSGMDIDGNYLYLANLNRGLIIIDISDIKHPKVVGEDYFLKTETINERAEANDVTVLDNKAYMAIGRKGIAVIDITNPKNPKTLNLIDLKDYTKALEIRDNYIYALCSTSLKILDLKGNIISQTNLQGYGNDLKLDGNYAFIAANNGLNIIDITNPKNPSLITTYDTKGFCLKLKIRGDYLYLANGGNFEIIDISNKKDPILIGSQNKNGISCHDLALDGDYVYILNSDKPCVLDVSNPENIIYVSNFNFISLTKKIKIYKNFMYLANDYNGIQIANIEDLNNIYLLSEMDLGIIINDIDIKNNTLFAAANNMGIKAIDISNPKVPKEISSLNLDGISKSIKIDGNYAFIAAYKGGVKIVDIRDPNNLQEIGTYDINGKASDIYLLEDKLLVTDEDGKLIILDISDKSNPKYISEVKLDADAYGIDVNGDYAFIANGDAGLCVVDISNLYSPFSKGCIKTDGNARDVKVKNNFAFISNNYKGIKVVDISDVNNMKIANSVPIYNKSLYSIIKGNKFFLANYSSGVKVFKILSTPKPVLNLKADNITKNSITLNWQIPAASDFDVINGIKIYRNSQLIKILDSTTTSFIDKNLKSDTKYVYEIKTYNDFTTSPAKSIEIKTLKLIPYSISELKVKDVDKNFVTLEWKDNSDNEDGFIIERDGEKIAYLKADTVTFTDRGVKSGKTYRYTIKAVNDAGESKGVSVVVTTPNSIPIPPTSLEALIIDNNTIKLIWEDNSDNEDGFEIYKDNQLIATTEKNATEYIDKEVKIDTLYVYEVKAVNDAGKSAADRVKVKIENAPPLPPTNFIATPLSENSIELKWRDNSDNEYGFEIYRNDTLIYRTKANKTSFIDDSLKPNTFYKYSIKAYNEKGTSATLYTEATTFNIDTKVPNPPKGFKALALSSKTIKLQWRDNSDNERGYNIYRNGKLIISLGKDIFEYFDRNLSPNSNYNYEIRTFNSKGESKGAEIKISTLKAPTTKPLPPLNFHAVSVGERAVEIRWKDNSDNEEGFKIFRDGKLIAMTVPNDISYLDTNLQPGTLYKYEIRATNDLGDSDPIETKVFTLNRKNILIPPTNLFASIKNGKYIVLNWKDNSDNEDGFKIFRNNKLIFVTGKNETQFVDFNLKFDFDKIYEYEVRATNENGDSVGDTFVIKSSSIKSSSPLNFVKLKIQKEGLLSVKISWIDDQNSTDKKYKIFRNDKLIHISDWNESEFIDTEVEPEGNYTYTFIVVDSNEEYAPIKAQIEIKLNEIQNFVYNLYKTILNRKPEEEGLLYWEKELKNGKSALYVIKQFIKLPEFSSKNVDTKTYIKILYKTFFNREPEANGLLYWEDLIDKKYYPKDIVFYKFALSNEFANICKNYGIVNYTDKEKLEIFIERFYQMVLGRESDKESRDFWVNALMNKEMTPKEVAKNFFESKEFKDKHVSNENLVKIAYRTLLDREPDRVGLKYWTEKLDNGLSRDKFLDKFLSTDEFERISKNGFANSI